MVIYIPGWKLAKKPEQLSYDLSAFRHLYLPEVDFDKISDEVAINESSVSITCNPFTKERNTESTNQRLSSLETTSLGSRAIFVSVLFERYKMLKLASISWFLIAL